jgi:hypothetical protein
MAPDGRYPHWPSGPCEYTMNPQVPAGDTPLLVTSGSTGDLRACVLHIFVSITDALVVKFRCQSLCNEIEDHARGRIARLFFPLA